MYILKVYNFLSLEFNKVARNLGLVAKLSRKWSIPYTVVVMAGSCI